MEILVQLMFLWVVWLVSPRRWQRPLAILCGTIAVILVSISSWGVQIALWGLTVRLPPDTGESADAIVVLGRGEAFRDLRTGTVQELWRAGRAPQIFASGMMDARPIVQSLKELGVPGRDLNGEECSRSTQENAVFTAALLKPRGTERILLVTDAAHMLRSLLIFHRSGFQVIPHVISLPVQFSLLAQQRCLLREYLALIHYFLTGEMAKPKPEQLISVPAEVTTQIQTWNCWVQGVI